MVKEEEKKGPLPFQKKLEPYLKAKELFLYKPKGCKECGNTGYSGRVGIFEVISMTEKLASVISNFSEAKFQEEQKRQGLVKMRQDGLLKALDGITTIEEVLRETVE